MRRKLILLLEGAALAHNVRRQGCAHVSVCLHWMLWHLLLLHVHLLLVLLLLEHELLLGTKVERILLVAPIPLTFGVIGLGLLLVQRRPLLGRSILVALLVLETRC